MIIRHTQLLQQSTSQRTLSGLKADLERQTEVAITGLEVLDPSDAAGEWQQIHSLQESLDDQDVYITNAQTAQSMLDTVDNALEGASEVLVSATELAIQLASESYNDDDRAAAANEVDLLVDQLISLANTQHDDRYLFAGTAYDQPAFADDGTYQGTTEVPTMQVGDSATVPVGLDGGSVFDDAIQLLTDLSAALRSGPGSSDATAALLDPLESAHDDMVLSRQLAGHDFVDAQDAEATAQSLQLNLQESLNARVAADPIEALTKLTQMQTAYETALQITAQTSSGSLFDYLR